MLMTCERMPGLSTIMQGHSAQQGNRHMTAVREARQRKATGQSGLNEAHE